MNDKVDTRVVRMEFDNKQFEKNVKQTSKSLDDLKQNLDFKGVGDSLDKVRVKISALEVAATTFVVQLTNKLIQLGTTMVKSLSVDNISSGWEKFGSKTISVATMMAQKIRIAGEVIEDAGQKTEVVTKQLELLAWFSDETSYSFTDMADNVGKFIAAGQDLDTSVEAMEGIATWAAAAGQNSQTASRAMYQLAQAMGKGKVVLQDWMSIQNANMDTEEFRETVLSTAVALGQLTKEGDQFVTKTGKKFTQSQFTQYLSEGWFTSEVLTKSLGKYSAAVSQIYELANRDGITASEVIEKYGDQLDKFGLKAFKAAQEARTFSDVLNSVKDAVSSKWMATFETVFGNTDESIELWTELANELYDVFAESGNFRNNMLSIWKEMGGRNDIFGEHGSANQGAFWNLYDAIIAVKNLISEAWNTIFPITEMEDENDKAKSIARTLKNITETIRRSTERLKEQAEKASGLRKIFETIFKIIRIGLVTIQAVRYAVEPIVDTVKQLVGQTLKRLVGMLGGLDGILSKIVSAANKVRDGLIEILDGLNLPRLLDLIFNSVSKIFKTISDAKPIATLVNFIKELAHTIQENLQVSSLLESAFVVISKVFKLVADIVRGLVNAFIEMRPTLSNLGSLIVSLVGTISKILGSVLSIAMRLLSVVINFITESGIINRIASTFVKIVQPMLNVLTELLRIGLSLIQKVFGKVLEFLDAISISLTGKTFADSLADIFDKLGTAIQNFFKAADSGGGKEGPGGRLADLMEGLLSIAKSLIPILAETFKVMGKMLEVTTKVMSAVFQKIGTIISNKDVKGLASSLAKFAIVIAIVYAIYTLLTSFSRAANAFVYLINSLGDMFYGISVNQIAKGFRNIGAAILLIAASIYMIGSVDPSRLDSSMAAIIAISGILAIFMIVLKGMVKDISEVSGLAGQMDAMASNLNKAAAFKSITNAIRSLSVSMFIIAAALKMISRIPESDMSKSLGIMIGISAVLIGIVRLFNKISEKEAAKIRKGARSLSSALIAFSIAMGFLAIDIAILSSISYGKAWNSVGIIVALLASFALMTAVTQKLSSGAMARLSATLLLFGKAMQILAVDILIISAISYGKAWNSVGIIITLLASFALMTAITQKLSSGAMARLSSTLLLFGVAMRVLSLDLAIIAAISYGKAWNSVGIIVALLASFALMTAVTQKLSSGAMARLSATLLLFGVAMRVLALDLVIISSIGYGKAWSSTGIVVALLASFVGIAALSQKIKSGAMAKLSATLMLFGIAMGILAQDLLIMSAMSYGKAWNGVAVIVALLGAMSLLAAVLGKYDTAISNGALTIAKLGLSVAAFGVGLLAIVSAISILISLGPAIGTFFTLLGEGLGNFLVALVRATDVVLPMMINTVLTAVKVLLAGIASIIVEAATPLAQALITLVSSILEILAQNLPSILGSLGSIIMSVITFVLDFLIQNVGSIIGKIAELLHSVITALTDALPTVINDIFGFVVSLLEIIGTALEQNAGTLSEALFKVLAGVWSAVMSLFGQEGITAEEAKQMFQPILDAVGTIMTAVQQILITFGPILSKIINFVTDFISMLLPLLSQVITLILDFVNSIDWSKIFGIIETIIAVLGEILPVIADCLNTIFAILGPVIKAVLEAVGPILQVIFIIIQDIFELLEPVIKAITTVIQFIGMLFKVIAAFLTGDKESIPGIWEDFVAKVKETWSNWVSNIWIRIGEFFKTIFTKIGEFFVEIGKRIARGYSLLWERIKTWFSNLFTSFKDWITSLPGKVWEWLKELWEKVKNIGKNIVNGIRDGITEGWENLKNKVKETGEKIKNWFTDTFKIHSPSKVFAQYGEFMMEGLAVGLDDGVKEQRSAMQNTLSTLSSSLENYLNVNEDDITIKVGMDISGVEEQSRNVRGIMSSISNYNGAISGAYGASASKASGEIGKTSAAKARARAEAEASGSSASSYTDNTTNNNVFNIQSSKPKEVAEEVDKILQERVLSKKLARGGI